MHLKEEERLGGAGELNTKVAYQKAEKQAAEAQHLAKISRIQNYQKSTLDAINERTLKRGLDEKKQVQNRLAKFQAYEEVRFPDWFNHPRRKRTRSLCDQLILINFSPILIIIQHIVFLLLNNSVIFNRA